MNNKLNDTEIKKALERCLGEECHTSECCFFEEAKNGEHCYIIAIRYALGLINRQKAKIERLQGCVKSEDEVRAIMKAQMQPMISETVKEQLDRAFVLGKSAAVKEFAERLKDTKFKYGNDYMIYADNIDNLVKEMVGDIQ